MPYRQRDLLLVAVPFSDLTSTKTRPVMVLRHDGYNQEGLDILVAAITSNLSVRKYAVSIDSRFACSIW
jgi:mRNA interferase MazF